MLRFIARYIKQKSANELNIRALKKTTVMLKTLKILLHAITRHACGLNINSDCNLQQKSIIFNQFLFYSSYLIGLQFILTTSTNVSPRAFLWRNIFLIFVLNSFFWPARVGMLGTCSRVMDHGWKSQNLICPLHVYLIICTEFQINFYKKIQKKNPLFGFIFHSLSE